MKTFFEKILLCGLVALVVSACSDTASQDYKNPGGVPEECLDNPDGCSILIIVPGDKDPSKDPADDTPTEIPSLAGEVVDFEWKQTLPWYYESVNHLYGFDKDPLSNNEKYKDAGKYVYVSVATDELARVLLKIDPNSRGVFRLNAVDEANNVVMTLKTGNDICADDGCEREIELPVGKYAIYYGDENIERYLDVVQYDKDEVAVDYVQFKGGEGFVCSTDDGCYEYEFTKKHFNEVYKQAVLTGAFTPRNPSDFGYSDVMEIDLTDDLPDSYLDDIAAESFDFYCPGISYVLKNLDKPDLVTSIFSELGGETCLNHHLVFAINEMKYVWRLKDQIKANDIKLKNFGFLYQSFLNNKENPTFRFKLYVKSLSESCADGVGTTPVPVNFVMNGEGTYALANVSLYVAGTDRLINFSPDCDALVLEGSPLVPSSNSSVAEISVNYTVSGVVVGGFVWAPRKIGDASQNSILHEIGHTLGLKDLFINYDDGTVPYTEIVSHFDDGLINEAVHANYTTKEANLMNYMIPTGPKLRYRDLPVVETGKNIRIPNTVGGWSVENQWECLRNQKCFANKKE